MALVMVHRRVVVDMSAGIVMAKDHAKTCAGGRESLYGDHQRQGANNDEAN